MAPSRARRSTTPRRPKPKKTSPGADYLQRKVKVVTEQKAIDKPSPMENFPMREWSLKIFILDEDGNERPADVFTKVVYNLHPTFENPVQTFTKAPFTCANEGWGEFEISIDCYTTEKTKVSPIIQDLNFALNRYEVTHTVTFKNPSQALQERLRETGPLPVDEDHKPKKKGVASKKSAQKFDYEKIADALEKLEEEDLLRVIQLINENKGPDTYIRSDVEGRQLLGEATRGRNQRTEESFGGEELDDGYQITTKSNPRKATHFTKNSMGVAIWMDEYGA
ncbi:hypothetical protein G7046_g9874 [Stylonectria norvegica]|nr:hypothetical protein G7046_g9874 [Stylonectria norvegica]